MDRSPAAVYFTSERMIKGHVCLPATMDLASLRWIDRSQCYQQTDAVEQYYTEHNSSVWQMFDESPQWVHDLANLIPQDFDHRVVSVIRLDPGQTIPLHRDKHYILQQKFGSGQSWRYLFFLEDWKSGHYFELGHRPMVGWRSGDYTRFDRSDWHLAGNMGTEPFYSAQVTALRLDKN